MTAIDYRARILSDAEVRCDVYTETGDARGIGYADLLNWADRHPSADANALTSYLRSCVYQGGQDLRMAGWSAALRYAERALEDARCDALVAHYGSTIRKA